MPSYRVQAFMIQLLYKLAGILWLADDVASGNLKYKVSKSFEESQII